MQLYTIFYCRGSERCEATSSQRLIAGQTLLYKTQEEAEAHIVTNTQPGTAWSHMTPPSYNMWADVAPWPMREAHLLAGGVYKHPVWKNEQFWQDYRVKDHYVHVSVEDPTMLAYTQSPEDGERNRQTRTKPGKYLKKFYGASEKTGMIAFGPYKGRKPVLTDQQIAFYAEWWEKGTKPSKWGHVELKFATTPDEIVQVYLTGPRSCMSSDGSSHTDPKVHPTQVYGAGDLAIAYLFDKTRAGSRKKIIARALCWPDKKVFGRCYPADGNYESDGFDSSFELVDVRNELQARLKALGWTSIGERSDVLEGAKLLKVPAPEQGKNWFRMPYLDNEYRFDAPKDADHFILKRNGTYDGSTSGLTLVTPMFVCPCCNRNRPEVDDRGRTAKFTAYYAVVDGAPADPKVICRSCKDSYTFTCHGFNVLFRTDRVASEVIEGNYYSKAWAEANGGYYCSLSGYWYFTKNHPPISYHLGNDVRIANPNIAREHLFCCTYDGRYYRTTEASPVWCGFPASLDSADISEEDRAKHSPMTRTQVYNMKTLAYETVGVAFDQSPYMHRWAQMNRDYLAVKRRDELRLSPSCGETPRERKNRLARERRARDRDTTVFRILAAE
jgi:hypothetical protein